jgi:DNA-binding NtrC family response regulator
MISSVIHVVDDDSTVRDAITLALETADYQVVSFADAETALTAMKKRVPDLVLLDIGLPGMDGIETLEQIRRTYPDVPAIMITAYEDIQTVVAAMKLGAYDYVVKPIHMDSLEVAIGNALETVRLRNEVQILQERYLKENQPFFIGESDAIQNVMELIGMVAKSPDTPILILGETGTGKELIASAIHYRSPNFKNPLITVNCAAIPRDLIESELFGYEKGAFSGADAAGKKGLIEAAAGGTLFLDEVGDLSLEAQAKLLRFLEEGEFYRLGGTSKLKIKTRVVSASNKDIDRMIDDGLFRKDLYFRLGVIKIQVPSLNARRDDILPLAKHFLYTFSCKFAKSFSGISVQAEKALLSHHWTGNVRELKNLIERGVLVGNGPKLTVGDLGLEESTRAQKGPSEEICFAPLPETGIELASVQSALERFYIKEALKMAEGNESKAAQLLRMNHHTFRYRRKKLQIE